MRLQSHLKTLGLDVSKITLKTYYFDSRYSGTTIQSVSQERHHDIS